MNTEINTTVVVAKATDTKKVKIIKHKKTDSTEKPAPKKSTALEALEVEDEVVADNVEEVKPTTTEKIIERIDPVVDAVEDTTEEVSKEVDKLEALRRQQLAIAKQIEMIESQEKIKKNITAMRKTLIDNRTAEIERLRNTLQDKELELATLKDLDDDELIDTITGNIKLETELGMNKPVVVAKSSAKKSVAKKVINNDDISSISSNDSKKRTPVKYDRDTQFSEMPTGMEMFIQYKGQKETFIKVEDGVRAEDGQIYPNLNKAGKAFYASIGADKISFNAWAEFKTIVNNKKVAVGDL